MKKTLILGGLLALGYANAQEGKVSINTDNPKATFQVDAYNSTGAKLEGVLIPRLQKSAVKKMKTLNPSESTLVYVTDDVSADDNTDFLGTGKGFYYYDVATAKWIKLGAEGGATVVEPFDKDHILGQKTTFAIFTPTSGAAQLTLGTSSPDGRNVCIWNSSENSNLVFIPQPKGQYGELPPVTGVCFVYYSGQWYTAGGY